MSLRNRLSCFVLVLFVVSSVSVFADTVQFGWTDTTSGVPDSVFTLSITPQSGQDFSATLKVNTALVTSSNWYIDTIALHFDNGQTPTVTNLTSSPGVHWQFANGGTDVDLLKNKKFPKNSWFGFYVDGIENGGMAIEQGVLLDGDMAIWTFDFTLDGIILQEQTPSIQVDYFNYDDSGKNGKIYSTQMSQKFPEPSTLILLLSSMGVLAGAAAFRRKT